MKQMLKLGFTLAAFAVVSCFLLALVNHFTAPVIMRHETDKTNTGMKSVFPAAESFEEVTDFTKPAGTSITIDALYLAKKDGQVIGAVTKVTGPTYDHATILVGQDLNQTITGMQFLSLSDSPGFGLKAKDSSYKVKSGTTFFGQFTGKEVSAGFKPNVTFDAISGATITSKGVGNILTIATYTAGNYLAEKYKGKAGSGSAPVIKEGLTIDKSEPHSIFTYEDALNDIMKIAAVSNASFTEITIGENEQIGSMIVKKLYTVTVNGKIVAAAASVSGQTYDNGGTVLTVVDADRRILGTRIIELNDSPELGMLNLNSKFYRQFDKKRADDELLSGKAYDAVTGASITSDCIADIVKVGAERAAQLMAANGGKAAPDGSGTYSLNEHYQEE
jgi:Na+-translocating ferredoxin:NAD+ oxidoreductase subunit G